MKMQERLKLTDKIILFPLWLLTWLPLTVLYVFSDFIYLILYYIAGYRRDVVLENLSLAFPEKSSEEIRTISKKFYRYLCDYFIESIYLINMSERECSRRYQYKNPELLNQFYEKDKNIILAISHYGNWEWACNLNHYCNFIIFGVYKPLSNKLFDRLFIYMRGRYGSIPVHMKHTFRYIKKSMDRKELFALYLVGDQRPPTGDLEFWTTFLKQETPVITGMDKIARKYDFPVIFMNVQRPRRGYYEVSFEVICDDPSARKPFVISEKYIRCVEKLIHSRPEYWLWSHKRFKYKAEQYKPKEPGER